MKTLKLKTKSDVDDICSGMIPQIDNKPLGYNKKDKAYTYAITEVPNEIGMFTCRRGFDVVAAYLPEPSIPYAYSWETITQALALHPPPAGYFPFSLNPSINDTLAEERRLDAEAAANGHHKT